MIIHKIPVSFLALLSINRCIDNPGACVIMKVTTMKGAVPMKYVCNVCGWVYDEEEAGVKWEDLPEDFACELCGVGKEDFSPEE